MAEPPGCGLDNVARIWFDVTAARTEIDRPTRGNSFRLGDPGLVRPVIKVNPLLTIWGAESDPVSRFPVST